MSEADRIRWHCRRGMLELDLVLNAFLERYFETLQPAGIAAFRALLDRPDPELLEIVMGHIEPAGPAEREVAALMRAA